jgi:hemoglobin/transferrin/lactoferrin receptor protein
MRLLAKMGNFFRAWFGFFSGVIGLIIFFPTTMALAQEKQDEESVSLAPVLVTATRVTRDLSEVPLSVSVIGEKQIEEKPMSDATDYLRETPGVQIGSNAKYGYYTFSIRGAGTGRSLILVDGVKQKYAFTFFDNHEEGHINVDPSEIERIEVIKGPASALYGSDALGGVVNVITKKGGDKPVGLSVGIRYDGSNESLVPRAAIYGTTKGFYYRVSGSGFNYYSEHR